MPDTPSKKKVFFRVYADDKNGKRQIVHEVVRWTDNFYAPNPYCGLRPPVPVLTDPVIVEIELADWDLKCFGFERKKDEKKEKKEAEDK